MKIFFFFRFCFLTLCKINAISEPFLKQQIYRKPRDFFPKCFWKKIPNGDSVSNFETEIYVVLALGGGHSKQAHSFSKIPAFLRSFLRWWRVRWCRKCLVRRQHWDAHVFHVFLVQRHIDDAFPINRGPAFPVVSGCFLFLSCLFCTLNNRVFHLHLFMFLFSGYPL